CAFGRVANLGVRAQVAQQTHSQHLLLTPLSLSLGRRRGPTPLTRKIVERAFGVCNNCSSDKIPTRSAMTTELAQSAPSSASSAGQLPPLPPEPLLRRVIKAVLRLYLVPYHRLEIQDSENLPPRGPALVLINHASLLDVPALMVLDPYPYTAT